MCSEYSEAMAKNVCCHFKRVYRDQEVRGTSASDWLQEAARESAVARCVCVSVFVKGWNITADGFVKSPKPDGL